MQYKLLVVDDEEEICLMLKEYFTMLDYVVYTAASGEEALKYISKLPDLIVLDVNMPGMDGFQLCRKIRDKVNVPILFLTAKIEEKDKIEGFLVGGDDYIHKGISDRFKYSRPQLHIASKIGASVRPN